MVLRWYTVVVDCHDVRKQADWWAEALGWKIIHDSEEECRLARARRTVEQDDPPSPSAVAEGRLVVSHHAHIRSKRKEDSDDDPT